MTVVSFPTRPGMPIRIEPEDREVETEWQRFANGLAVAIVASTVIWAGIYLAVVHWLA